MPKTVSLKETFLLLSLYTTQFIGLGFFTEAFVVILSKNGMPLENLGFIYMLGLFWIFKFLWAPIVDRVDFKKFGHYKGWIAIMQSLMVLVLLATSFFDVKENISIIIALALLLALFSATQNIALDALMYKSIEAHDRAKGNALKISGGLIGTILGGGLGLVIYAYVGWSTTVLILGALVFIALAQLFFFEEEVDTKRNKTGKITLKDYIEFWKGGNRARFLIFILLYPASISSAYGLINPLLVDVGWSVEKIGYIVHMIGYGIGIIASFATAPLVAKFGRKKVIIVSAIGQCLGLAMLFLPTLGYTDTFNVAFAVGVIFLFYTPSSTIISTIMMDKIPNINPASEFAIFHSSYMFAGIIYATLAVFLASIIGYQGTIAVGIGFGVLAIILSINIEKLLKESIEIEEKS